MLLTSAALIAVLIGLWLASVASQLSMLRWSRRRFRTATAQQASLAHADLFERDGQALSELGFEPLGWCSMDDPDGREPSTVARVLVRRAGATLAVLHPISLAQRPNELSISLVTRFADARTLTSVRNFPLEACFSGPVEIRRSHAVESLEALLAAHGKACAQLGAPAIVDVPDWPALVRWFDARWSRFMDDLVARRWLRRGADGSLRLCLRRYLPFFHALARTPSAAPRDEVPMARQLALLARYQRELSNTPTAGLQWALMVVITTAFALCLSRFVGDGWAGPWLAPWIALTLILHEGGRYLAMRALGYRGVRLPLLAVFSRGTVGIDPAPSGVHQALVALAATLPGIILGWVGLLAWFGASTFDGVVLRMAAAAQDGTVAWLIGVSVLLVFNYALLLPLRSLAGGELAQALLPATRPWLVLAVVGAGLAVVLVYAWRFNPWLSLLIAALQVSVWLPAWRQARLVRQFRAAPPEPVRDAQLLALCAREAPDAGLMQHLERAIALRSRLDQATPAVGARLLVLLLWLAPFGLLVLHPVGHGVLWLVRVLGTP